MELSWEAGGMKLHNSIESLIRRNVFRNTYRADHLWLDCGNENNRITQNVFINGIEQREAIVIECTKDEINSIDNNIIWNVEGRFDETKIPQEKGSSGWYKTIEDDLINGYGIYGEGTDYLHISNNLIGKCRSAGYYAKPVAFRMGMLQRGGTSRDASIKDNLFYDCKEAAIKLPTKDNEVQGNAYINMSGGYLRILNTNPEVCLDLPTWQKFYQFDMEGVEGWFDIEIDAENLTMQFMHNKNFSFPFVNEIEKHQFIYHPSKILKHPLVEFITGAIHEAEFQKCYSINPIIGKRK